MEFTCQRCKRKVQSHGGFNHGIGKCQPVVGVYYVHDGYGCDTGCCGHRFFALGESGDADALEFEFTHDRDEVIRKAGELAAELKTVVLEDRCEFYENC